MYSGKLVNFLRSISLGNPAYISGRLEFRSLLGFVPVPVDDWPEPMGFGDPGELPGVSADSGAGEERPTVVPIPGVLGMVFIFFTEGDGMYIHFDVEGTPAPVHFAGVNGAKVAVRTNGKFAPLPLMLYESGNITDELPSVDDRFVPLPAVAA